MFRATNDSYQLQFWTLRCVHLSSVVMVLYSVFGFWSKSIAVFQFWVIFWVVFQFYRPQCPPPYVQWWRSDDKFWAWWIHEKDYFSIIDTASLEEKIQVIPIGVKPMTFLFRYFVTNSSGESWIHLVKNHESQ